MFKSCEAVIRNKKGLMLCREIIVVCCENRMEHVNIILCGGEIQLFSYDAVSFTALYKNRGTLLKNVRHQLRGVGSWPAQK
jgi:hypothetical protein